MMYQTYTIELWIRPDSSASSMLYSVSNTSGSSILGLSITDGTLRIETGFVIDGPSVTIKSWQFVAVLVTWSNDKNYSIEFEVNEVSNGLEVVPDAPALFDNYTFTHTIGNDFSG